MSLFKRHGMFDCEILLAQTWSGFAKRHGAHLYVAVGKHFVPECQQNRSSFLGEWQCAKSLILLTMKHCTVDLDQMRNISCFTGVM